MANIRPLLGINNDLYLFPSLPGKLSGYSIAVQSDMEYYRPKPEDYIVFITEDDRQPEQPSKNILFINRNNPILRLSNLFSTGHPGFFSGHYLQKRIYRKFGVRKFKTIFYGDINFFTLFFRLQSENAIIRLHNLYHKMYSNMITHGIKYQNIRILYEVYAGMLLEKKIFYQVRKNNKLNLLTITDDERNYCIKVLSGKCKTLPITINMEPRTLIKSPSFKWDGSIVWFGGVSSHKKIGIDAFLKRIYLPLSKAMEDIKFDLYGSGTLKYHNPDRHVYGHGFVETFNYKKYSQAIFINPDIIGGGIKLKLYDLYVSNLRCLSTPYGVEGFPFLPSWENMKVLNFDSWYSYLIELKELAAE